MLDPERNLLDQAVEWTYEAQRMVIDFPSDAKPHEIMDWQKAQLRVLADIRVAINAAKTEEGK